jgi:hypothetical protein
MSTTVTADATVNLNVSDVATGGSLASADSLTFQEVAKISYGGTNPVAIAVEWSEALTFAVSTPQTLNLLSLPGPRGTTTTFASGVMLYIYNLGAHPITVGNAATNPWVPGWSAATNTQAIAANSRLFIENGGTPWPVNSGACNLLIDPGAFVGSVRVIIWGN